MHELTEYKSYIREKMIFAPIDEYKQTAVCNHHLKLAAIKQR